MRTFNFKARLIGDEKYLTYTMGEETELDEDVLDYCEENDVKEIVPIIYEEDDDYDYLTYDITNRISINDFIQKEVKFESVINILRNVADGLISVKEQAIPLSYILLNREFMYIDESTYDITFICLPVESQGKIMAEFKGFMRQILANMKYDVEEDTSYVGKLLTYINGDNFNLRGLIGLTEALMEEAGVSFEAAGTIDANGVEVMNTEEPSVEQEEASGVNDFMNSLADTDEALPEIGDDEEDVDTEEVASDEELESILPKGMVVETSEEEPITDETTEDSGEETEEPVAETTEDATPEIDEGEEDSEKKEEEDSVKEEEKEDISAKAEEKEEPSVKEEEEEKTPEKAEKKEEKKGTTPITKETDIETIRQRLQEIVKEAPTARSSSGSGNGLKTIEDLDNYLDSRPPVVKRNVVKVNRAAIIQNVAAEEAVANSETEELGTIPVVEDITEDMNVEKADDGKPKSKSILSKSVPDTKQKASSSILNAPKAMPYLIRVNTEERIMLNKPVFKIGKASRGVDYTVGGNGAISRQHAIISQRDGVCYIKDNKSTNHTYVNGKMIEEGAEEILTHESMIKLGDEEFLFKIR